jgi:hypothetical protein
MLDGSMSVIKYKIYMFSRVKKTIDFGNWLYGPRVPSPDIASASRVHLSAELNDLIKIF